MPRSHARLLAGALPFLFLACGERVPPTAAEPPEEVGDLLFHMPPVTGGALVSADAAPGPEAALAALAPAAIDESEEDDEEIAQVISPRTLVVFVSGGAYAEGFHVVRGHAGRVETTVRVTFDGKHLGSQTAVAQRSWWLSLTPRKLIGAIARIYTEATCGLVVQGSSVHAAWLQAYSGESSPTWGRDVASTTAGPIAQKPCGHRATTRDPTNQYEEDSGLTCYYLITYDIDTGEIHNVEFLRCESNDGDKI